MLGLIVLCESTCSPVSPAAVSQEASDSMTGMLNERLVENVRVDGVEGQDSQTDLGVCPWVL